MKRRSIAHGAGLVVFMLCGCLGLPAPPAGSAGGMDLDAAIGEAAAQMEAKIPSGTMVALVSVASPSTAFSSQVLTRLESAIVSGGKLVVVDRANLDKVREEQGFQLSGEVDDESAKSIGKLLGAGAIATGALADLGDVYSLTLKAINIETATVAVSYLADIAKSTRIETLLASGLAPTPARGGQGGGTGTAAAQAAPQPGTQAVPAQGSPPAPAKEYKVGGAGPAGGFVFYDKGNDAGGWRYLEAAPASTEQKVAWSSGGAAIRGTNAEIGTGKQNTQAIVIYALNNGASCRAATVCDNLVSGGYDDWFLPSKAELNLMFVYLQEAGIGGFKGDWYWSSSESGDNNGAWSQHFGDGSQGSNGGWSNSGDKTRERLVRAVRQF